MSADNVISELAKIGFANLADFYTVDTEGRLVIDTATLSDPTKAAALSQIEMMVAPDGAQSIKIKLADKRAALGDLSKHLGLQTERHEFALARPSGEDDADPRRLALAAIALLSEAAHQARSEPLLIEHAPTDRKDGEFDLD